MASVVLIYALDCVPHAFLGSSDPHCQIRFSFLTRSLSRISADSSHFSRHSALVVTIWL
ncbi:hypothetical protein BC939DRAFT_460219 [Gamsiella multidivaricata]|uniref:uncharacterized protein n=1 Tax=Gamsiella multidivaricata TaxID=101098 RepID=UPI00221EA4E3|nr:uncharacterized protein BC939DRAFT_460219 [Gamsiella multidivaricata]KAI7819425.1 hypothetical protein BC939DRAFT_460219 [Gamsiella multidivaricata]